jgi:hypothetical protein
MQPKHLRIAHAIEEELSSRLFVRTIVTTRHWVKDQMNAKTIIAALALSLALAACAKKDEAPVDTAPAASEPAAAPSAEPAPADTPPADQAPADATPAPADSGSTTPPADAPKQ